MTSIEFIKWLDEEIAFYQNRYDNAPKGEGDDYALGCLNAYEEVKEKFLTVLPPPSALSL